MDPKALVTRLAEIEARLLRVEDHNEILHVIASYGPAADSVSVAAQMTTGTAAPSDGAAPTAGAAPGSPPPGSSPAAGQGGFTPAAPTDPQLVVRTPLYELHIATGGGVITSLRLNAFELHDNGPVDLIAAQLAAANRAVRANPRYVQALIHLGRLYGETDRTQDAIDRLAEAIDRGGDYPDVHLLLGRLYRKRGDRPRAKREFERALELNSGYTEAAAALAELVS